MKCFHGLKLIIKRQRWRVGRSVSVSFTQRALVNIQITGSTDIARRAGTEVISTDGVGVTVGALLTRVADAGVVQLAQKTWCTTEKADFTILN